jgi:hypothetical protein
MLTAAAASTLLRNFSPAATPAAAAAVTGPGYGTDPVLAHTYKPGDIWPLTMTEAQRHTAAALCAIIIPADATSPSAAQLGVHDFIDEWISAPYPDQALDRPIILDGLAWLDAEAQRRFGRDFTALAAAEQAAICDDICAVGKAAPPHAAAAIFFARFRDLTAGGFYSTPEGMKDIGYVGNVPLATFDGPPAAVLKQLGIA